jgi:4-aminobutyrate aminotransferase
MLIADEVQTGFARTGKLFAMQQYDVLADLITMAKSLRAACRCRASSAVRT